MLSSASRLALPLFVSLSLVLATLVEANDLNLNKRDHLNVNMKRIIKKRQGPLDIFGPVAGGAQDDPTTVSASLSSDTLSASQTASALSSGTSLASSTESVASSTESLSASSTLLSSTASVSSTVSSASQPSPTSETLNLTGQPTGPSNVISTVIPTVTRTEPAGAANQTTIPAPQSNAQKENGTTLTIIIAIAASLGGIAILWTVFRKWKLSSSKRFDQRLNPIDFEPTAGDASASHRRTSSNGSSHSSRRNANLSDRAIEQHDLTAGPMASNVGGYADLARGSSPTQMSEQLTRGPSINRDYDYGVPLHHQGGYGNASYNTPRY